MACPRTPGGAAGPARGAGVVAAAVGSQGDGRGRVDECRALTGQLRALCGVRVPPASISPGVGSAGARPVQADLRPPAAVSDPGLGLRLLTQSWYLAFLLTSPPAAPSRCGRASFWMFPHSPGPSQHGVAARTQGAAVWGNTCSPAWQAHPLRACSLSLPFLWPGLWGTPSRGPSPPDPPLRLAPSPGGSAARQLPVGAPRSQHTAGAHVGREESPWNDCRDAAPPGMPSQGGVPARLGASRLAGRRDRHSGGGAPRIARRPVGVELSARQLRLLQKGPLPPRRESLLASRGTPRGCRGDTEVTSR